MIGGLDENTRIQTAGMNNTVLFCRISPSQCFISKHKVICVKSPCCDGKVINSTCSYNECH